MSDLKHAMRSVMGHFATGVAVVTARGADGAPVGTTVNALTSVSLEPPLLLVCLAQASETLAAVTKGRRFAVNILGEHQHQHSVRFAAKGAQAHAHEIGFEEHPLELPCLPGSLATLICGVDAIHPAGDHEIVLGEVLALSSASGELSPLLFFRGDYSRLAQPESRRDALAA